MALVQSMAIQFNSGLQQSYAQLVEDVGTGVIRLLQNFADTERVATISGKSKRSYMRSWTKHDIADVSNVVVDIANPITKTTSGKLHLADQLLAKGMVESPDQYLQVLTTGKLDPVIEGKQAEIMNVRAENESLSDNDPVVAVATDNHALHITEHKTVLASPEARRDPTIVQATLGHIYQHIDLLRKTDPGLLAILGQQALPPAQPPGGQGTVLPGGNPESVNDLGLSPPPSAEEAGVNLPSKPGMPDNPLTGNKFTPETGGM
jgi:hypothetical protein